MIHSRATASAGVPWNPPWIVFGGVIIVLLFLNLLVVLRITLRQNEKGELGVGVAVKGKAGKGWYGGLIGIADPGP